jgi:hypothetical protein
LITLVKLKTYKSTKFLEKNNENILTFIKCYGVEAKLTVEGFKEWTELQAILYLMKAVKRRALEVTLVGVAILGVVILGGRTIAKYVEVLNYLKVAFIDLVKSEKTLNKLICITQCSDINTYIWEFNILHGQTSLIITILEVTIL